MIGCKLDQAKGMFFDSPKIVRSVDAATRKVLSRFGAFVRTAAKSSIRKRKKESQPGSPPSSHSGLLKQFIYFGYEPETQNVVIGPTKLNKSSGAPETLEYGGTTTISKRLRNGKRKPITVTIAARPFMHPAFNRELPKLPAEWRDSVKP